MKKYLITGCAGFIGSNFVYYMLNKYKDILLVNLDKLTYAGNLENLKDVEGDARHVFVQGDICDRALVTGLFEQYDFDYVINFAAESHVDRSITNPEIFVETNVLGTVNLLQCAKNAWLKEGKWAEGKKYLQVSTDEVYGSLGAEGYFTETTPLCPHSPYSSSKASADMFVMAFHDTYGMPVNITRCSNNYGPYQFNERPNIFIVKTIIAQLHERLADDGINEGLIKYVADRLGHDRRYGIDPTKIKNELGWYPETIFEVGIVKTIDWYLSHEEWMANVTSGNYQKYYEEMYKNRQILQLV